MVSHDFRSPLASIKASVTGLLQEGKPWEPETQRELLQGIDHETDRLNRMVGSILALSRLEADVPYRVEVLEPVVDERNAREIRDLRRKVAGVQALGDREVDT